MKRPLKASVRNILFFTLLGGITVLSALLILKCTIFSPRGFSDSVEYFSAARNLAAGRGLGTYDPNGNFTRLTVFAPLYPVVLNVFLKVGFEPIDASRIIDIFTFGSLVFLAGLLLFRMSSSFPVSLGFAVLIGVSYPLVRDFTTLMSEPLAITLGVTGVLFAMLFVLKRTKGVFILSGVLTGLSFFSRYAFIAFPVAAGIILFLFHENALKSRLKALFGYFLLSIAPMAIWMIVEYFQRGSIGARNLSLDGAFFDKMRSAILGIVDVAKYWLPYRSDTIPGIRADFFSPLLLLGFGLLIVVAYGLYFFRRRKDKGLDGTPFIICTSFVIMFFVYLSAVIFFYVSTESFPLDERILSPSIPPLLGLLLGSVLMIDRYAGMKPSWFQWTGSLVLVLLFVVYYGGPIREYSVESSTYPDGFGSPAWKDQPIFQQIQKIPLNANDLVYSNGPDMVLFYNNINPHFLTHSVVTGADDDEIVLSGECRYFILFPPNNIDRLQRRDDPVSEADIARLRSVLAPLYEGGEGIILSTTHCVHQ